MAAAAKLKGSAILDAEAVAIGADLLPTLRSSTAAPAMLPRQGYVFDVARTCLTWMPVKEEAVQTSAEALVRAAARAHRVSALASLACFASVF